MQTLKERALEMVRALPPEATWEDLMYQIYVQERIEKGIQQGRQGKVVSQEEIEREFLDA